MPCISTTTTTDPRSARRPRRREWELAPGRHRHCGPRRHRRRPDPRGRSPRERVAQSPGGAVSLPVSLPVSVPVSLPGLETGTETGGLMGLNVHVVAHVRVITDDSDSWCTSRSSSTSTPCGPARAAAGAGSTVGPDGRLDVVVAAFAGASRGWSGSGSPGLRLGRPGRRTGDGRKHARRAERCRGW
jgi:hypothetical protein